jgi:hypothetical protein
LPGPFIEKEVSIRETVAANEPTGQVMNVFWQEMFAEVGREVPKQLIWEPGDK